MLELGHSQVGDRDEVFRVTETSGGSFRLLQQAVHRLDVGVAAPVEHAAHDAAEVEQLLVSLRQAGVKVEDLEIGRADLEDVFLQIMEGAK